MVPSCVYAGTYNSILEIFELYPDNDPRDTCDGAHVCMTCLYTINESTFATWQYAGFLCTSADQRAPSTRAETHRHLDSDPNTSHNVRAAQLSMPQL